MASDLILTLDLDTSKANAKEQKLKADFEKANNSVDIQARKVKELEMAVSQLENEQKSYTKTYGNGSKAIAGDLSYQKTLLNDANVRLNSLKANASVAGQSLRSAFSPKPIQSFKQFITKLPHGLKKSSNEALKFKKRIFELAKSALLFSVLTRALTKVRELMGKMLKTNAQFSSGLAQVKGNLLTAFQPLYETALPYLITFINWLARATASLGMFFAQLTGKSYSAMQNNSKALYEQANATDEVANSTKKANKQLASFDELNVLSSSTDISTGSTGTTSGTTTPAFAQTITPNIDTQTFKDVLWYVGAIGLGIAGWKIASAFGASLLACIGIFAIIVGVVLLIKGYMDAWQNGIDWKNFTEILGGVALAAVGVALAVYGIATAFGVATGSAMALAKIIEAETGTRVDKFKKTMNSPKVQAYKNKYSR